MAEQSGGRDRLNKSVGSRSAWSSQQCVPSQAGICTENLPLSKQTSTTSILFKAIYKYAMEM